jgi:3-oxoacyl-[acyl-carrier protein] reductase
MTSQLATQEQSNAGKSSILKGKRAVIFGAGGSIGSAVAREFAAEGAEVYLAGRSKSNVEDVTNQIIAAGGRAHSKVIDALDDAAVNDYFDSVVKETGKIDVVFNRPTSQTAPGYKTIGS